MAERKTGPVKPPVIELKARETSKRPPRARPASASDDTPPATPVEAEAVIPPPETVTEIPAEPATPAPETAPQQPDTDTVAKASEPEPAPRDPPMTPPPPPPPQAAPRASSRFDWPQIGLGAAGGALLGLLLALLLAAFNLWPAQPPDPRLEGVGDLMATLDTTRGELAAANEQAAALASRLEAMTADANAARDTLSAEIAEVRRLAEAAGATAPPDLAPLAAQIESLSARVDAVAAGATTADAAALGETVTELRGALRELTGRAESLETRAGATDQRIAALAAAPAQPQEAVPADIEARLRLPLLLSGLETAFVTGRPFAAELGSVQSVLPGHDVPASLAAAAASGLMRQDVLAHRFEAILPEMLAARAGAGSGDWARDALDWGKALLALRPAGEMAGDEPDAVVSRLEAAMDRQDYASAASLFALLPEPMRNAAAEVPAAVATRAEATAFFNGLRSAALATGATP